MKKAIYETCSRRSKCQLSDGDFAPSSVLEKRFKRLKLDQDMGKPAKDPEPEENTQELAQEADLHG